MIEAETPDLPDAAGSRPTRWQEQTGHGISARYLAHLERERRAGTDLDFEARFVDAVVPRHSRILDGGCGQGRTGGSLHGRGHTVVGVDIDPVLIAAAEVENPGPIWAVADLATMDLVGGEGWGAFDAVVLAGDVMSYLAPDSEPVVLSNLARHLTSDGVIIAGFHPATCDLETFDAAAISTDLVIRQRFASWRLAPWPSSSDTVPAGTVDYCVTILQKAPRT